MDERYCAYCGSELEGNPQRVYDAVRISLNGVRDALTALIKEQEAFRKEVAALRLVNGPAVTDNLNAKMQALTTRLLELERRTMGTRSAFTPPKPPDEASGAGDAGA